MVAPNWARTSHAPTNFAITFFAPAKISIDHIRQLTLKFEPRTLRNKIIPLLSLALLLILNACQRGDVRVYVEVDHGMLTHLTSANTIGQVLQETNITLGDLDRVEPDLYVLIQPEMTIKVIRVTEKTETITNTIPFEQRIMQNEALPEGEQRLAQLGVNGMERVVTKITLEDGVEVSRTEVSRMVVEPPVAEILIVGGAGDVSPVTFGGSVTYISGGNAWLMKENSTARRLLTTSGDLDGHVFSLSPAGTSLLFSRTTTDTIDAPLNELWQLDTRIVGEPPVSLPVQGVLYAEYSPLITDTRIAYSTADRSPNQPGWRAQNDLWLWDTTTPISTARQIVPPNTRGLYAWWGTTFRWSPDGTKFAYATAGEVGVIDVISGTVETLMPFVPYQTNSEWVWVPTVSWSPDSRFIATVIHGEPLGDETPEASQQFDLWILAADGSIKANLATQTGMWSNPIWTERGIFYGQALLPLRSVNSRYKLIVVDADGSNPEIVFPVKEAPALSFPELTHPAGAPGTMFVYHNDLYFLPDSGGEAEPLTANHESRAPRWVIPPTIRTTAAVTATATITPTAQEGAPRENSAD